MVVEPCWYNAGMIICRRLPTKKWNRHSTEGIQPIITGKNDIDQNTKRNIYIYYLQEKKIDKWMYKTTINL